VIARSKCSSDSQALKDAGIARSTFYEWDESIRARLNELAQQFKRETALRVLMVMQENAESAADAIAGLVKSRNENVKLKASQDILDRVIGKATQSLEVSGKGGAGSAIEVRLVKDDVD
jgi:ACT domain-containing protein